jgi:hypothetical protein
MNAIRKNGWQMASVRLDGYAAWLKLSKRSQELCGGCKK